MPEALPIDIGVLAIIIQLIFLEGILSIDNAAVLGAMVSVLPADQPVPYPRSLGFLQGFTDRALGMQRSAALKVGLLGAYIGRGLMLLMATYIIRNPWLRLVGAVYLIKLAFEHLPQYAQNSQEANHFEDAAYRARNVADKSFWAVVLSVELADLAFSLDNVVAAVALSDHFWVVMAGVALGILTMRFAAGLFTRFIQREPILAPAAYILVLNIGIELIVENAGIYRFNEIAKFAVSIGTLVLAVVYAHSPFLQKVLHPVLGFTAKSMDYTNQAITYLLRPAGLAARLVVRTVQSTLHLG